MGIYGFRSKSYVRFSNNLKGLTFGVWGLSFKPKTNDMREAPSITIINKLLENGATVKAFDPQAFEEAKRIAEVLGYELKFIKKPNP